MATFYDCINTIYQFIKPFLENQMSVFGAFKVDCCLKHYVLRIVVAGTVFCFFFLQV